MREPVGSISDLRTAYREGRLSPTDQAERVLDGLASSGGGPVWISTVPAGDLRT
ncbi:hypothetical protein [Micromonospora sp. NPDC049102]|uniref:hypothetical protein n=1 Tax=Micromonospora sp. NPDC049102 TaxID=3364265 RepID=UPI003715E0F9